MFMKIRKKKCAAASFNWPIAFLHTHTTEEHYNRLIKHVLTFLSLPGRETVWLWKYCWKDPFVIFLMWHSEFRSESMITPINSVPERLTQCSSLSSRILWSAALRSNGASTESFFSLVFIIRTFTYLTRAVSVWCRAPFQWIEPLMAFVLLAFKFIYDQICFPSAVLGSNSKYQIWHLPNKM